jgi:hypothetical protein
LCVTFCRLSNYNILLIWLDWFLPTIIILFLPSCINTRWLTTQFLFLPIANLRWKRTRGFHAILSSTLLLQGSSFWTELLQSINYLCCFRVLFYNPELSIMLCCSPWYALVATLRFRCTYIWPNKICYTYLFFFGQDLLRLPLHVAGWFIELRFWACTELQTQVLQSNWIGLTPTNPVYLCSANTSLHYAFEMHDVHICECLQPAVENAML